ncbi:hypothetical protein HDV06_002201, partial [Boothiomyces sp. JEL0866]
MLSKRLHNSDTIQEILCLAATVGQIDVINLIETSNPVDHDSLFLLACESDQLELAEHLLPKVSNGLEGLNLCIIHGYLEIIVSIVESNNVDLTFDNNLFIRMACLYGHTKVAAYLLNDERVDPTANENQSLKNACKYGYLEIVKLLIQDERIDPLFENNIGLELAIANGHLEIASLLQEL